MCTNVCAHSPSKACCSALLCWRGHVATLKLLSERPVKLLRSSTTLAVGSGNPSASCSLRTHTHTPLPASLPSLCLSCSPSHAYTCSVFLCSPPSLSSLSVCICLSPTLFFVLPFSLPLFRSLCFPHSVCSSFWPRYLHNLCSETSLRTFCLFWHRSGCTCFLLYTCSDRWKCTLATDMEPHVAMMAV